jgi:hypothetical protein
VILPTGATNDENRPIRVNLGYTLGKTAGYRVVLAAQNASINIGIWGGEGDFSHQLRFGETHLSGGGGGECYDRESRQNKLRCDVTSL